MRDPFSCSTLTTDYRYLDELLCDESGNFRNVLCARCFFLGIFLLPTRVGMTLFKGKKLENKESQ